MREEEVRCTLCPIKCRITIEFDKDGVLKSIRGASCPRGSAHIRETLGMREIFSGHIIVRSEGGDIILPVRTTRPIPKDSFSYANNILTKIQPPAPILKGETVIFDFIERGVNLIAEEDAI